MGFVKTPSEVADIERALSRPRYVNGQRLGVEFLVDPRTIARLLPPPLEPADVPLVTASVGRWQSNMAGDFHGGALHVAARHAGVEGSYVLAIYMDSEHPIVYGRDVVGEPKKLARCALFRGGSKLWGWLDRGGARLLELTATMEEELSAERNTTYTFNFKSRTAANGIGLEEDAILTQTEFVNTVRVREVGTGTVTTSGTVHDPFEELGQIEVVRAVYAEYDTSARCEAVATVPASEFLPYHYGRMDSWQFLDTTGPSAGEPGS